MRNSGASVAIVLHIYYLDVAERMLRQFSRLANPEFSLWVTVSAERRAQAEALVDRYCPGAEVRDFDNVGMDVLPFLRLIPELVENRYTAVVKLHTKRGQDSYGRAWGQAVTEGMCREPVLRCIHRAFEAHPGLDVVGLAPFYLSARRLTLGNQPYIQQLVDEIPELEAPPMDWGFFAGTIFAARLEPLLPLARWADTFSHRFSSGYEPDGLWEHALERVFTLMARRDGAAIGLVHDGADDDSVALQRVSVGQGISQAYTRELATQVQSLEEDVRLLSQCNLLDMASYALDGEVAGELDFYRHYLLIGQFDKRCAASKAWALKRHNERVLPWSRWAKALREPGLVSVIIPVLNQPALTEQCIRSLFAVRTGVQFEVVCVDNGSEADTAAVLERLAHEFPAVRVVRNETNLNFALGCNLGFGESRGERVVFLNNDTEVTDGWLDRLMQRLEVGDCFAVQPQLRYPDGTLQCMGVVFSDKSALGYPIYGKMAPNECSASKPRQFKALTAACLALNASDFAAMTGFDALYINGQEDVDLCLRLHEHTGKLGAYVPDSLVIHHESKTEGRFKRVDQNRTVFVHRWAGAVKPDDLEYYLEDGFTVTGWRSDGERRDARYRIYRPVLERMSVIHSANQAFLAGDYAQAGMRYTQLAFDGKPGFPGLEGNFAALRRYWLNSRRQARPLKVGVCSWSLGHNPAGRAATLAEAYAPHADVELLGSFVKGLGKTLWEPVRGLPFPCHTVTVNNEQLFVRQAFELVARHPYDIVHLSKPRIHNVIFGWLYQLVWGARVFMDVDDEELGFVEAETPLNAADYIREHGALPAFEALRRQTWTRLAVGFIDQFDGVTVSNPALQRRYGGQLIPHVRPAQRFEPSSQRKAASRREFGIPPDKTVFLFYGTPRIHKGVGETARALAQLQREDICYVIVGSKPNQELADELASVEGLDIRLIGPQPYERAADVVAMADACVLLQATDSLAAQFQLPAKLMDALGMGLTVFAQVTPAMEDLAEKGAFIPITRDSLVDDIKGWLDSGSLEQAQKGRAVFERELTVEAVAPVIQSLLADNALRRARALTWEGQLARLLHSELPAGVI